MMDHSVLDLRLVAIWIAGVLIFGLGLSQLLIYLSVHHRGKSMQPTVACALIAGALLCLTTAGSLSLARWTGLSNIGWYLGYSLGAIGCYLFGRIACITDVHDYGPTIHRFLWGSLIGLLLLQALLYATHLLQRPEWLARTPRSGWELLFSVSFFLFCTAVALVDGITISLAIGREANPAQRLRLWINLGSAAASLVCFVGKFLYLSLFYFYANWLWIDQVALLALALVGPLLFLANMPGGVMRLLVRLSPATRVRQLWQLFWLKRLTTRIYGLMPALVWRRHRWGRQLRQTRLSIYQLVIAILDGKRHLAGCLEMDAEQRQRVAGIVWSAEQQRQADALIRILQPIDHLGEAAYPDLIQEVVRISRQR